MLGHDQGKLFQGTARELKSKKGRLIQPALVAQLLLLLTL